MRIVEGTESHQIISQTNSKAVDQHSSSIKRQAIIKECASITTKSRISLEKKVNCFEKFTAAIHFKGTFNMDRIINRFCGRHQKMLKNKQTKGYNFVDKSSAL